MIAWGRIYWSVHKYKDRYWRELGSSHREKEHALYQEGLALVRQGIGLEQVLNWMYDRAKELNKSDWERGLPADLIEAHQAGMAHDCWDMLWNDFTPSERLDIGSALRDIVLKPEAYPNLFEPSDYDAMCRSSPWRKLQRLVHTRSLDKLI